VRNQVDGILLVATGDRGDFLEALVGDELPLVTLDRAAYRPGLDSITAVVRQPCGGAAGAAPMTKGGEGSA
jgi:DNA-binding LacI/PurR family transcriptional regulator